MKKSLVLLASFLLAAPAFAADPPKTEQEKTLYAIGNTVSRSLSVFNL
jgi:FKBP-type peptidyl-prolyl cis-trans isomerase FkpA